MATRILRDGILTSERVNSLDWEAEVFYRRLMSIGDDFGLFDARPTILRPSLYPLKLDQMRETNIQRCLDDCSAAGLVRLYEVKGKPYGVIVNYGQRIRKESKPKYPVTPEVAELFGDIPQFAELCDESRRSAADCGEPPSSAAKAKAKAKTYAESKTKDQTKTETNISTASHSVMVDMFPQSGEDVLSFMRGLIEAPRGVDELRRCAESFFDDFAARGWRDSKGIPLHDWRPAARKYARSWVVNDVERKRQRTGGRKDANEGRSYRQ